MRSIMSAVILSLCLGTFAGCIIPAYSADPVRRATAMTTANAPRFMAA